MKNYSFKIFIFTFIFGSIFLLFSCFEDNNVDQIIFVPGYGSKKSLWEDNGFMKSLKEKDDSLNYAGNFNILNQNNLRILNDKRNYFCVSFLDSTNSIDKLSIELEEMINFVLDKTNSDKVILVAYSMGGIVARKYLTSNLENHNVRSLITICSPHKGSYLSNILYVPGLILGKYKDKIFGTLANIFNFPFDGIAIQELFVEQSGTYLHKLNRKEHPMDIDYFAICAKSKTSDFLETMVNFLDAIPEIPDEEITFLRKIIYKGDLVVEVNSQDINGVKYLSDRNSFDIEIIENANHFSIMDKKHHNKIYSILKEFL